MITFDHTVFPANVISLLVDACSVIDSDVRVVRRPLLVQDEIQAIGIFPAEVNPVRDSKEMVGMGHPGYSMPTLTNYSINIQGLVKHGDAEEGIAIHSVLARRIFAMVARNEPLRLALGSLIHEGDGLTERAQRWEILQQRFQTRELNGLFHYLSVTEFQITTQTT